MLAFRLIYFDFVYNYKDSKTSEIESIFSFFDDFLSLFFRRGLISIIRLVSFNIHFNVNYKSLIIVGTIFLQKISRSHIEYFFRNALDQPFMIIIYLGDSIIVFSK